MEMEPSHETPEIHSAGMVKRSVGTAEDEINAARETSDV